MKALINIGHGEGFGLPLFEAVCHGLPVITVTWSGQSDFISKPNKKGKLVPRVIKVDYNLDQIQPECVWPGVLVAESKWAYAKESSYKRALRDCLEKEVHWRKEAETLRKHALETFAAEKQYELFVDEIKSELSFVGDPGWLSELDSIIQEYE